MTRDEGLALVQNAFHDEPREDPWFHSHNGETYEELYVDLVYVHHLDPQAAVGILAAAHGATSDEYGN